MEEPNTAEKKERAVFVSPKAVVVKYADDGSEEAVYSVGRNVPNLVEFVSSKFSPDDRIGIYLVEDEEKSDPPQDGEPRRRANLVPDTVDRDGNGESHSVMKAQDAVALLASAAMPDHEMSSQLQAWMDEATVRSRMECAIVTAVFDGRPSGFVFLSPYRDLPTSSLGTLYEAASSQVGRMKDEFRKIAPGIRFSDDGEPAVSTDSAGIVLPSGMDPSRRSGGIITPEAHPSGREIR